MNGLLTHMALLTLSMSFIILLVLLFIKTFGNRFSAKSRYIVWTILVFSLCIGIGLYKLPSLFTIEVPMPSFVEKATTSETITPVVNAPSTVTPTNPLVQGTNNNTIPSDVDKTVHTLPVVSGEKLCALILRQSFSAYGQLVQSCFSQSVSRYILEAYISTQEAKNYAKQRRKKYSEQCVADTRSSASPVFMYAPM